MFKVLSKKVWIPIMIATIIILVGGVSAYQYLWLPEEELKVLQIKPRNDITQQPVACTQEAKVCLDGSSVDRTGPNCEFAACPTIKLNEATGWKIYKNEDYGFELEYPPALSLKEESSSNFSRIDFENSDGGGEFLIIFGKSITKKIVEWINPIPSDYLEVKKGTMNIKGTYWNTIEEQEIPAEGMGTGSFFLKAYNTRGDFTYALDCRECYSDVFGEFGKKRNAIFNQIISTFKFLQ